ncbi:MAG TPA: glycosyltransferase family 4 protein [Acidimicrobiia bacterium]|nr:glycosyltransferase family 4 protein [Acidimicrobiia bacterium]
MRIYWYWPHPHRNTSPLCLAVMTPGDSLVVHALPPAAGESLDPITEYDVIRDLPDPTVSGRGALRRALRPIELAARRSRARTRLVKRGFDVAHIGNLTYQTDWADLARLRRRVPLVSDVHDVRPHRSTLPARLEASLLRRTYRNAGQLIVLHDVLKEEMVGDFGVSPERVHVVPVVLDARATRDQSIPRPARPRFLFFGTLRANKGIDVLIEALTSLGPRLDADVVIAGAGDAATTSRLSERLGGMPNVTLEFGRVSALRMRELFSQVSWVLLPYVSFHSQSGVLSDAYAYGVPLIVSDVGAIGPTVRADGTGFVVEPGDAEALADAMLKATATTEATFAAPLAAAAARHHVSVVGARLRAIYDLAAAEG